MPTYTTSIIPPPPHYYLSSFLINQSTVTISNFCSLYVTASCYVRFTVPALPGDKDVLFCHCHCHAVHTSCCNVKAGFRIYRHRGHHCEGSPSSMYISCSVETISVYYHLPDVLAALDRLSLSVCESVCPSSADLHQTCHQGRVPLLGDVVTYCFWWKSERRMFPPNRKWN